MSVKLAVFDMDGTICDTIEDLADAVNVALTALGYPTHTPDEYKYMVGHGIPNLIFRALPEDKRTEQEVTKAKEIMLGFYKEHFVDKTRAYEGINELLLKLKDEGIHIAVCTNKAQDMAEKVAEKLFGDTFELVLGKTDDRPLKPDPSSVNEIMKRYGADISETVFIGDSGVDMQTAVNSKAIAIGVLWGFRGREELKQNGAEFIASTPNDIYEIIKKL